MARAPRVVDAVRREDLHLRRRDSKSRILLLDHSGIRSLRMDSNRRTRAYEARRPPGAQRRRSKLGGARDTIKGGDEGCEDDGARRHHRSRVV